ncbi:MAG: SirB2 family protein [Gammaproteobacteria bacterium]
MDYATLKTIHITTVVLSFAVFAIRGGNVLSGKAAPGGTAVRVLSHVINTVLLLSALWMVFITKQWPFVYPWPTVKLLGLVAYVVFAVLAFRGPRGRQALFFLLGTIAFLFTASVGLTHNPLGFLKFLTG